MIHRPTLPFLLAAAVAGIPAMAGAAEDEAPSIIVTATATSYRAIDTGSATKTLTPLLDVPQAVTVLTSQQLRDQAIVTMADAVRTIPGMTAGQGEGHRDQVTIRGNNSTADFFVDGLRDDAQYIRGLYNTERIEAFKGANAMIFGRGGGGGVLNRVTKIAQLNRQMVDLQAAATSFGGWTVSGDANLPSGNHAVRLNSFYEQLRSHREAFAGTRFGVAPTARLTWGTATTLDVGYEYVDDRRVVDRGIPSATTGTRAQPSGPADGLRDWFFGDVNVNRSTLSAHTAQARLELPLSDTLRLTSQARFNATDKIYTNAYPATALAGLATAPTVGIEAYRDPTNRRSTIGQANLIWTTHTGSIGHVLLAGVEGSWQSTQNERINGFFDPLQTTLANRRRTVALTNPLIVPPIFFVAGPGGAGNRSVRSTLAQLSGYVQDQIALGEHINIIAGVRFDQVTLSVANRFTAERFRRQDAVWAPRLGLVYKPVPSASLYASFSRSFLPQSGDQFTALDVTTQALEPETFNNYEIGAKWDITPGLTATLAAYQLNRGNTRAAGPTPGTTVLSGAQRSRGVELGLAGALTPDWRVSLGYAYTTAEVTSSTLAAVAGQQVAQVPRHQLSVWSRYSFSPRLGAGVGAYYQSRSFASISNTTALPGYTRFDGALYLTLTPGLALQLNVENLANTRYFPLAHNDNNITPGAPRTARLTLDARF